MYRYHGVLKLDGNVYNEVAKENMSAAEVMILRKLHGNDAFRTLEEGPNDRSDYDEERADLIRRYVADGKLESRTKFNEANFVMIFGPPHMQLPTRLDEFVRKEKEEAEQAAAVEEAEAEERKAAKKHGGGTAIDATAIRMAKARAARKTKTAGAKKKVVKAKTIRRPNKTDANKPTMAELAG